MQDETKTPCSVNLSPPDPNVRRSAYGTLDEPFRIDIYFATHHAGSAYRRKKSRLKNAGTNRPPARGIALENCKLEQPQGEIEIPGRNYFFSLKHDTPGGNHRINAARPQTNVGKEQIPGGETSTITVYGRVSAPEC